MPLDRTLYQPQDSILAVLRAVQERIREPERWCQERYGDIRSTTEPICVGGALLSVSWMLPQQLYRNSLECLCRAAREEGFAGPIHLNDGTDHKTTCAMLSRAIELRQADIMETADAI